MAGAVLTGATLRGADLSGADFTRSMGLTNEQLARACGDGTTILPQGLAIPDCSKKR